MKKPNPFSHLTGTLALLLAGTGSQLHAETAAAANSGVVTDKEPVVLSPFEVSSGVADDGYGASNSIGATRTKTLLIELPQNIQVFNEQFRIDVGATDTWESIRYASNVTGGDRRQETAATGTSARGYNLSMRVDGVEMPWAPERVEDAMYERIELVKGSSSVLYGSTTPGGILNYVTKKPSLKPATQVSLRAGSYDYYKGVFDTTGPLLKREKLTLAYRLVGAAQDSKSVRDNEEIKATDWAGTIEARIANATMLRFRVENQIVKRVETIAQPYLWEPSPVVSNPPGGVPITSPGTLMNLPISFFRGEPDDYFDTETTRYDFTAEHRIDERWTARAYLAYTDWGRVNRETGAYAQTTTYGIYTRETNIRPSQGADTTVGDFSLLGEVSAGPTKHLLLLGAAMLKAENYDLNLIYRVTPNFNALDPLYGVTVLAATPRSTAASRNTIQNRAFFIQDQVKIFNDRLHLTVGLRQDNYNPTSRNLVANTATNFKQAKVSPRYSALYRINEGLSVYYAFNETFQPATATRGDGTLLDPPTAKAKEIGLKFSVLDGRFSGSAAAFTADLGNQARPDTVIPTNVLNTSFKNKGIETDVIYRPIKAWQIMASAGYLDTEIYRNDTTPALIGHRLGGMPKWTAAMWTKYDFANGFSLGGGFQRSINRWGSDDNNFKLPDYTVCNLLARYAWGRYTFSVNADNILDKRYIAQANRPSFAIPGEPRRIFGNLMINF